MECKIDVEHVKSIDNFLDREEVNAKLELRRKMWVVNKFSDRKKCWDIFIILLAIVTVTISPLALAFKPEWSKQPLFYNIHMATYIPFLIDIIINFRTTFVSADGEEQFENKEIIVNYLTEHFIFDFLTTLPVELLFLPEYFKFIVFLRVIKVARMDSLISTM